ncbi:MAG: hypothetical protein M9891_04680 [Austwickia sp.]|nr:hypothetical protein [Austwickia sp.]
MAVGESTPGPGRPSGQGRASAPVRTAFLLVPGLALLAGLNAALLLVGVWAPVAGDAGAHLPARHGMLMVLGFLGTLIALERAVALRSAWGYAAPACLGAGGLVLAAGLPATLGAVLLADGAALLLALYVALYRRRGDTSVAVESLGALSALVAALLWLRLDVPALVAWLVAFIVTTIAAERVDLARLALPSGGENVVLALSVALVVAAGVGLLAPDPGARAFGAVLIALVVWLARYDVARRTIRSSGLPRFSAAAMLLGYFWLGLAGAVWLLGGRADDQASYDVAVHATFLGFAMSMVLAHAPVILPAIARRPLPYHRAMWVPLAVLHAGLAVRVAGDLAARPTPWQVGSVGTVLALLMLPPVLVTLAARSRRTAPARRTALERRTRPQPDPEGAAR